MDEGLHLYSYWRSSAAYRVRIALALKGLAYETVPVHLLKDGGQQHAPDYAALNPQKLVPLLAHGRRAVRQSLAIMEYLEEVWPERGTPLLPDTARERGRVRGLALLVACDIRRPAAVDQLEVLAQQSGAGLVKAVCSAKGELKSLDIDPSIFVPSEKEVVEDLILAAIKDAQSKAQERTQEEMRKLTAAMGLPADMKLPI